MIGKDGKAAYTHDLRELVVDGANNRLYVTGHSGEGSVLFVVDTQSLKVINTIPGLGNAKAPGLALDAKAKRVYTSNLLAEVVTVGTDSGRVEQRFKVSAEQPMNIALDPAGKRLFVTDQGSEMRDRSCPDSTSRRNNAGCRGRGRGLRSIQVFGLGIALSRRRSLEEAIARIAQGIRNLGFAHNVDGGAALPQLAAETGKVAIARYQAERVSALVEEGLKCVERQGAIGCFLLRGVLKLKAGRKRLPNQRLFPAAAKRVSISVAPAYGNPSFLRGHQQCEINDLWRPVVASIMTATDASCD